MHEAAATRLSIVTPALNQAGLLAGLIHSLNDQRCPELEHIVVDGGSTDGTLRLLRSHGDALRWVSEPDGGQGHAINKGFALASGDILGWINCDDRFTPGALRFVLRYFEEHPDVDFLYGDALAVDASGRDFGVRWHVRPCDLVDLIDLGDPIVQPAAFWRRRLWDAIGPLDETLDCAFDYEFWMRAAEHSALTYVPVCLAVESIHADAKTSTGGLPRLVEIESAARRHGGEGLPVSFRAEEAGLRVRAALGAALGGRLDVARAHVRRIGELNPPLLPSAMHATAACTVGPAAVPRMRLWANRMRGRGRTPVLPDVPASIVV